jgi:hypothetical protein
MDKRQLIDGIRQYNSTAQLQFLDQFDEAALKQYLEHLEEAHQKRATMTIRPRPSSKLRMVS